MRTITVDDGQLAVNNLLRLLTHMDPSGSHVGTCSPREALEYQKNHMIDIAFLDIEMPQMDGLELAKAIKEIRPETNIIFVTGYSEYALKAHELYASGYLLKPVGEYQICRALENLRHPLPSPVKRLRVQCFGSFEVFVDDRPLVFRRSKTKELFAYLIDRRGASCTMGQLLDVLWENKPDTVSQRAQLRNLIADLRHTMREAGLGDVIIKGWNCISIDISKLDCDYYNFLRSDPLWVNTYAGEYMAQYSWAEMTTGLLYFTSRDPHS